MNNMELQMRIYSNTSNYIIQLLCEIGFHNYLNAHAQHTNKHTNKQTNKQKKQTNKQKKQTTHLQIDNRGS